MDKVIIYPNGETISILYPAGDLPLLEVARKDVPANTPYKVIDKSQIPQDRTFRLAWDADFSQPDGYGIGRKAWFIERYGDEIALINSMPAPEPSEESPNIVDDWVRLKTQMIAELNQRIQRMQEEA